MLGGQLDSTRLHLLRAEPGSPGPCALRALSLSLAPSRSPLPPQISTVRDLAPSRGCWNPDVPFPSRTSSQLRRAPGPWRCLPTLPRRRANGGTGELRAGEGQAESCDADPSKSPFQQRGQGHTHAARRGAEPRAGCTLAPPPSPRTHAHTHKHKSCPPSPDLLFSSLGVNKPDQFSFNPRNNRGSPSWELASLRPASAHCRPGVKSHLSFSPPEASSWYFYFSFPRCMEEGGWRNGPERAFSSNICLTGQVTSFQHPTLLLVASPAT